MNRESLRKLIAPYENKKEEFGNHPRICLKDGCTNQAIESHIVQCNGILDVIAEEGRVIQPSGNQFNNFIHSFRSKPIRNALTFKEFCAYHDDTIFKSIEQDRKIDFSTYKNLLFLSYRSILFVYRERELMLEIKKWALETKFYLKGNIPVGFALDEVENHRVGFESIKRTKAFFETHL